MSSRRSRSSSRTRSRSGSRAKNESRSMILDDTHQIESMSVESEGKRRKSKVPFFVGVCFVLLILIGGAAVAILFTSGILSNNRSYSLGDVTVGPTSSPVPNPSSTVSSSIPPSTARATPASTPSTSAPTPVPLPPVFLVLNSAPTTDIILGNNSAPMVTLAAEYFQDYVEQMTGVKLPISRSLGNSTFSFHVFLGVSEHSEKLIDAPSSSNSFDDGEFVIQSSSEYLLMYGDDEAFDPEEFLDEMAWDSATSPDFFKVPAPITRERHSESCVWELDGRGTMNAVFYFLRRFGFRWYFPNSFGTIAPPVSPSLAFSPFNASVRADFSLRAPNFSFKRFGHITETRYGDSPFGTDDDWMKYIASMGVNSINRMLRYSLFPHGLDAVISRDENVAAHPDYYAVWGGVRRDGTDGQSKKPNMCSVNLVTAAVKYVKAMVDLYDAPYVSLWPADGLQSTSQHDQECIDRATPERPTDGTLSDYVWNFINTVAWQAMDQIGPDNMIICGAYSFYRLPPLNVTDNRGLAPNIAVFFTYQRKELTNPAEEARLHSLIDEWISILPSKQIFAYSYYSTNRPGQPTDGIPFYYPNAVSKNLKFLNGKSRGESVEVVTNWPPNDYHVDSFAFESFNLYLTSRLYWDANLDVDDLITEYFDLYFGTANDKMRQLFDYSENHLFELRDEPKHLVAMRALAEEALTLVPDGVYRERIQYLLNTMNVRYLGESVSIRSCQQLSSPSTTYVLTSDVENSSPDDCFEVYANGVTLDCAGFAIRYNSSYGIFLDYRVTGRGHHFSLRNCVIESKDDATGIAVYMKNANFCSLNNTVIRTDGEGVRWLGVLNSTITQSLINATEMAMYSQYGGHGGTDLVSSNTITWNLFNSSSNYGAYLYNVDNEIIAHNEFYSSTSNALRLWRPKRSLVQENIFQSPTSPLFLYQEENITLISNSINVL